MPEPSAFSKLSKIAQKGENGTILVIGGSERYTGAPIFTSLGAMKSGSDLVYVFTDKLAVQTIKSLHEAIVLPIQFDTFILDKITCCVIGPGLGIINDDRIKEINEIISYLNSRNVPFVFDADAIHFYKNDQFLHPEICVLTPNIKESKDLIVEEFHYCIYKGPTDIIKHNDKKIEINISSSLKRCGGQGDILSGLLATALSIESDVFKACISACELMRKSSFDAYNKKGFSLITSDIFDSITKFILEETEQNSCFFSL